MGGTGQAPYQPSSRVAWGALVWPYPDLFLLPASDFSKWLETLTSQGLLRPCLPAAL